MKGIEGFELLPRLREGERVVVEMPRWRCFCCNDTGIVRQPHLIVRDYGYNDPEVVCTACGVAAEKWGREPTEEELARLGVKRGEWRSGLEVRDTRAPREVCEAIHERNRAEWLKWYKEAVERKRGREDAGD